MQNANQKKNKKHRTSSVQRKLLLIIIPLFLLSFVITTVLMFVRSGHILLDNSKNALVKEADSYTQKVTIDLLTATGCSSVHAAYVRINLQPAKLQEVYQEISNITIMDAGTAFMVNAENHTVVAHSDSNVVGRDLTGESPDSFLGMINSLIVSGETSLVSLPYADDSYYTLISYIDDTPWALVSCVSEHQILADMEILFYNVISTFLVVLFFTIIIVGLSTRKILKPVKALNSTLTSITDGDFTVDISCKGNDEIAMMSSSLEDFLIIMRQVIQDINTISTQLSDSSETTKTVAGTLENASSAQADSMSDVKVTIDQLVNGVQELAEHASTLAGIVTSTTQNSNQAWDNMQQTVEVASKGRSDMEAVNQTMYSIVNAMKKLEEIVTTVGQSTEKINAMVSLISDIAEQTNLLSLNAAIEAARAGDAGRGFAVVAEEIRKLAEVSASSASQISNIISQVNADVSVMVDQTGQSVTYIEENSGKIAESCAIFEDIYTKVTDTNQMLSSIAEQMNQVDDIATNIAAVSEEQSASTEEILASTEILAENSLKFTADSKKVAESSEAVSEASFTLSEHMRRFKIR